MKKLLLLLTLTLLLSGCRTPGHIGQGDPAKLSVGMSKADLVRTIGPPETVATEGAGEVYGYTLDRDWWQFARFQIHLLNGKVQSYEVIEKTK